MKTAICGMGICGGFGTGIEAFQEALEKGVPPKGTAPPQTDRSPFPGPVFWADTSPLEKYTDRKALRRMDHFSQLALLAAHLALEDAGNPAWDRSKMGLIVASGYGALRTTFTFLDSFIEAGDKFSSPTPFSHSVHNAALAQVSMFLGVTGPGLTVSQFEMSVPSALLTARIWLEEGRVDSLLFGAVDEYNEVLGYCWKRFFGGWEESKGMDPLDFEGQTAVPGEGAVFFLLTTEEKVGSTPYGGVERIRLGRGPYDPSPIPPGALLILGADGQKGCGVYYRQVQGLSHPVRCYSPLYGSFPTSSAFDLAAAAVMLKEGKMFTSPSRPRRETRAEPFHGHSICCLKMGAEGEWGEILLRP